MGLAIGGLLELAIITYLFLFGCKGTHFGEYKTFFQPTFLSQHWYIAVIIFREMICLTLGFLW